MTRIERIITEATIIHFRAGDDHTWTFKHDDVVGAADLLKILIRDRSINTFFYRAPSGDMIITSASGLRAGEARSRMSAVHPLVSAVPITDIIQVTTEGQIKGLVEYNRWLH